MRTQQSRQYQWAPIAESSPVAAAGAALLASGVDGHLVDRLAPIAAGINRIDAGTPVNPDLWLSPKAQDWPGIHITDDGPPTERPSTSCAYVLEIAQGDANTFGKQLAAARAKRGMTQAGLADKTGAKQPNIHKMETGHRDPGLKTLQALAAGMDMAILIRPDGSIEFKEVRNAQV